MLRRSATQHISYVIYQKQQPFCVRSLSGFLRTREGFNRFDTGLGRSLVDPFAQLDQRQDGVDHRCVDSKLAADFLHDGHDRIDLHRPARFAIHQHRGLVSPDRGRAVDALFHIDTEMDASCSAMPCASSIIWRDSLRTAGSLVRTSSVAPVSALMGLKQRLPHNFSQISSRMLSRIGASMSAALMMSWNACRRGVTSPLGLPIGNFLPYT